MNYIKKTGYFWVLAGIILCVASVAHAEAPVCFLKGSGITTAPTGTPCTDAKTAYDGTKTLIDFNDGCTGSKTVDLLFQQEPTSKSAIFGYQVSMRFNAAEFSDPVCTPDPAAYFFDNALTECPATHQASGQTYVFTGESNFTEGHENDYPADMPNIILMRVAFTSHITEGATGTFTQFTQSQGKRTKVIDPGSAEIQTGLVDADAICTAPPFFVLDPTAIAGSQKNTSCAGDPPAGTADVDVTVTLPPMASGCKNGAGATVNCATPLPDGPGCTARTVTVSRTSPTAAVIGDANCATGTTCTVTDTGVAVGTDPTTYAYKAVAKCTAGAALDSAEYSDTGDSFACGALPVVNAASTGFVPSSNSVVTGSAECGKFLQGRDIAITGAITDDDTADDGTAALPTSVKLYYGTSATFPQTTTGTVTASGNTGNFTVNLPRESVNQGEDIYWAVEATDPSLQINVRNPATFDGTSADNTNFISGECIQIGTRLAFVDGSDPYPNQMPFRSGGQILILGFEINESAIVTMRIYAPDGTLIRQIENSSSTVRSSAAPTPNVCNWQEGCSWDGTTYLGTEYASNGLYIVNIYAIGTGQNFANQTINYTKGIVVMK